MVRAGEQKKKQLPCILVFDFGVIIKTSQKIRKN